MADKKLEHFIQKAREEVARQEEKWGKDRDNHPAVWSVILSEEVGEFNEEICESKFDPSKLSKNYETELVQIVAVGLSALMNIEKYQIDK